MLGLNLIRDSKSDHWWKIMSRLFELTNKYQFCWCLQYCKWNNHMVETNHKPVFPETTDTIAAICFWRVIPPVLKMIDVSCSCSFLISERCCRDYIPINGNIPIYIYICTHTWNLLWNSTRWVRFLCHNIITVRVIWVCIISYVLFLFKVYNCLVIGEKYMRRAVSWANCAVYHVAVRFREKKCTAVSFCLVSPMCHNAFEILLTAKKI